MEEKQDQNKMIRSDAEVSFTDKVFYENGQGNVREDRKTITGRKFNSSKAKNSFLEGVFEFFKAVPVFCSIVLINILVYLIMLFNGVNLLSSTTYDYIKWGSNFGPLTLTGEWWRVITCCFIHKGFPHLVNNIILFFFIGLFMEIMYGKRRFAYVYLVSGLFSSYFSLVFRPEDSSVGASGAVFGILGLLTSGILFNKKMIEIRKGFMEFVLLVLAFNLFYGFTDKTINLAAHIGGFLTGFVLGVCYVLLDRLVPKEKIVSYQNVMEMFYVLLFIFLLGNMASNVPAKYILMKRLWDAGVVDKQMERKKAKKQETSWYEHSEHSVDFDILLKKRHETVEFQAEECLLTVEYDTRTCEISLL